MYINNSLALQIDFEQSRKHDNFVKERQDDLQNLQMATDAYMAEETAFREKQITDK